jgi:hypothetical protein
MKIANSVWLNLYMRDYEKVQPFSCPLAPAWEVLNFQHIKVLESIIPKDQKTLKYGQPLCLIYYSFNPTWKLTSVILREMCFIAKYTMKLPQFKIYWKSRIILIYYNRKYAFDVFPSLKASTTGFNQYCFCKICSGNTSSWLFDVINFDIFSQSYN